MRGTWAAAAALLLMMSASGLEAQVRFGPHLAYGDDTDFAIGGRVLFGLQSLLDLESDALEGMGAFSYYLDPGNVDGLSVWELDAAVVYNFVPARSVRPYARGGLNLTRSTWDGVGPGPGPEYDRSDIELGVGLGGGVHFVLGTLSAFADGRLNLGGAEQFVLAFGILFGR